FASVSAASCFTKRFASSILSAFTLNIATTLGIGGLLGSRARCDSTVAGAVPPRQAPGTLGRERSEIAPRTPTPVGGVGAFVRVRRKTHGARGDPFAERRGRLAEHG